MTVVSGNIRLVRGFLGDEASNDSGVIENVGFQSFRALRLRHLRKWGQHYYIVLFSPLSPFHWPQNTWPWMTVNGHFRLNFHYYEQHFYKLFYTVSVEPIYRIFLLYHVTSIDVRKRTEICGILFCDPRKDCGSFVNKTLRSLRRRNLNK